MRLDSFLAHVVWDLFSRRGERQFLQGCAGLRTVQLQILQRILAANHSTIFGIKHRFSGRSTLDQFRSNTPLSSYGDYRPYLDQIAAGREAVLTNSKVLRFHLTSGTSTAAAETAGAEGLPPEINKRIPYTKGLQREFHRGIAPWMRDLYRQFPGIRGGRMYWVLSPQPEALPASPAAAVISSFDQDFEYLPAAARAAKRALWCIPPEPAQAGSRFNLSYCNAYWLLGASDLRFLSLWNASYFSSLLEQIRPLLPQLADDLAYGAPRPGGSRQTAAAIQRSRRPLPKRAALLRSQLSQPAPDWQAVWPELKLISCWCDGWSAGAAEELAARLPQAVLQPKGLLATEGIVTIPYSGPYSGPYPGPYPGSYSGSYRAEDAAPVLAAASHFFEFIRLRDQAVLLADELTAGERYEVVMTTSGGLYRYRLGDIVGCEGYFHSAPRLRFLGRSGIVSDICGEKLDEPFVSAVFKQVFADFGTRPSLSVLVPEPTARPPRYSAILSKPPQIQSTAELNPPLKLGLTAPRLAAVLDQHLSENFHYCSARLSGQLGPVRVIFLERAEEQAYLLQRQPPGRASTAKIPALDCSPAPEIGRFINGA